MNNWLKVALYSFIGIIIGSFFLGILGFGTGMNMGVGNMQQYANGYGYYGNGMESTQGPMNGGMRRGVGMQGGMGMHGRR